MQSSLPVPSKAALTVLRGLALGTSCTIALIVEDRRRRINNAVRVISNSDKLKSCRKYHSGGKSLTAALEQEAADDSTLFKLPGQERVGGTGPPARQKRKIHTKGGATGMAGIEQKGLGESKQSATAENEKNDDPFAALIAAASAAAAVPTENLPPNTFEMSSSPPQAAKPSATSEPPKPPDAFACLQTEMPKPTPFAPPKFGPIGMPTWSRITQDEVKESMFPSNDEIMAKIYFACTTKDERQLVDAIRNVLDAYQHNVAPDNQDAQWLEATAQLSRTCQELGRTEDAAAVLETVVKRGPIRQAQYVAHEPVALLETLIAQAGSPDSGKDAYIAKLDRACRLFLAKFEVEAPNPALFELGGKLLEMADLAKVIWRRSFRYLFQRCNNLALAAADPSHRLTPWFITKLYEAQCYTSAIETFLWTYQRAPQTANSINEVAYTIIQCVENANNHRADHVLKGLARLCAECQGVWNEGYQQFKLLRLKAEWVIRLLQAHWRRCRDFDKVEELFGFLEPELDSNVSYPEGVYRIMTELALEAGDEAKAQFYFDTAVLQGRCLDSDVRMLGLFARYDAKAGRWDEVRKAFETMVVNEDNYKDVEAHGRVFIPVLKSFAEQHTVHETDNFMRAYVDEFKVPLNSYMVTLMAKEYAKLRDVDSIVNWLDHCSHAGFKVDAAFSNAILVNIRRYWNMPFRELRTLFRKLRELSEEFIDEHTEQVMAKAALIDSRYGGAAAMGRLASLRLTKYTVAGSIPVHVGKMTNRQLIEDMRAHLICERPKSALMLYKKVTAESRLQYNEYALRLALKSLLQIDNHNFTRAFDLVRKHEQQGESVTSAVNYLLAVQMADMKFEHDDAALPAIQGVIQKFKRGGLELTHESIMLAAFTCLKQNQPRAAIEYALEAAKAKGQEPCYSLRNFKVLCVGAAQLGNTELLTEVIKRGLDAAYREEEGMLSVLKEARLKLRQATFAVMKLEEKSEGHILINNALRFLKFEREKTREDKDRFDREALEIMRRAALDAGNEPVDFNDIPWLGGGKDKRPKIRDEVEEMMAMEGGLEEFLAREEDEALVERLDQKRQQHFAPSAGGGDDSRAPLPGGPENVGLSGGQKSKGAAATAAGTVVPSTVIEAY